MKILLIDSAITVDTHKDYIFCKDQAYFLKKNNYEVDVINSGLWSFKEIFKNKTYEKYQVINGVQIYRKYEKNLIPYKLNFLTPLIIKKISSITLELFEEYLKSNEKPDLIHAHKIRFSAFAAYAIYLKYNIPYIITEHNSDVARNTFPKSIKKLTKDIIKKSKNFNTVSKENSKILSKYFNIKKIDVLNNLIPEIFTKKYKMIKKKNYLFFSVTRFDKNKNVKIIIDSFIKNFYNLNATLHICGGGILFDEYKSYIKKKGFQKKIKLYKFLPRKKILKKYCESDCFIISSHTETFCLSLFEALMFRLFFITSRHSGYYELLNKSINLPNFESTDDNKLSKLMLYAYYSRKKFYYKKKILKYFGKDVFLKKIKKLYMS